MNSPAMTAPSPMYSPALKIKPGPQLLHELRVPLYNRLETLRGDRRGQHSIRINDQYRICFTWTDAGPGGVEIVDYH
jgi:proteic killer suppression protein